MQIKINGNNVSLISETLADSNKLFNFYMTINGGTNQGETTTKSTRPYTKRRKKSTYYQVKTPCRYCGKIFTSKWNALGHEVKVCKLAPKPAGNTMPSSQKDAFKVHFGN